MEAWYHARIFSIASGCILYFFLLGGSSSSADRIPQGSSHDDPPRLAQEHGQETLLAKNPLRSRVPGGLDGTSIDWEFIAAREGGQWLTGYVLRINNSRCGVTVATGVDLGQRSAADIDRLSLPEGLKRTLKRYAEKTGKEAEACLRSHPLSVTGPEAAALDTAVRSSIIGSLKRLYRAAALRRESRITFETLPPEAQTVIASVAIQYGPNLEKATPRFWKSVTIQDWETAVAELMNFGDRYPSRRSMEARLLLAAVRRVPAGK